MKKGFVTIPTDSTFVEETKELMELWGADAIRDCDGVTLPDNLKQFNCDVYKAYFIVREDHEYPKHHKEYLQSAALSTKRVTAFSNLLEFDLYEDLFREAFEINDYEYKKYFQVFDRTTGIETKDFSYLGDGKLVVNNTIPYHQYSCNFIVRILWDPVQIYNYHVNNWTCEKDMDLDPVYPEALNHMLKRFETWLIEHPDITVIRFTTFFYNFFIVCKTGTQQTKWDWHNYAMTVSPKMLDDFKKETNLDITLEDICNEGLYLGKNNFPTETGRKYVDFVQKKCCEWAKLFVDICHKYNRKAMMFDGDHRIGVEPYNPYFETIGLDAVVGAPSDGIYIQQIANMKGVKYTEGRFSPYFFPNECPGDEKGTQMLTKFWNSEKRGMLRKPIDRIGFGGYLKQIYDYPNFKLKVKQVCDEFRTIKENAGKNGSKTFLNVAIMSYWGKMDSWMFFGRFVDDFSQNSITSYSLLASLCGQPVNVDFISFDEAMKIDLSKYDCLINAGVTGTTRQGDYYWKNPKLLEKIREYVLNGGSFFGIGDPTGYKFQGRFFQLEDVLGVQKEQEFNIFEKRGIVPENTNHWILNSIDLNKVNFTTQNSNVYPLTANVLKAYFDPHFTPGVPDAVPNIGNVSLSVNEYGKGRSVYLSGVYDDSFETYKLIYRILLWCSRKEYLEKVCYSLNSNVDIFYYEDTNNYALLNNSNEKQIVNYYDMNGILHEDTLEERQLKFVK